MSRTPATRARARARTDRRRKPHDVPRRDTGTLAVMFLGSAIAVLVVAAGIGALLTEGIETGADSVAADEANDDHSREAEHDESLAASPADISITAEHLGEQRVGIEALVTMNEQRRPLGQAQVEAYVDMIQMPGAHTQGPLELQPDEEPGVYTTVATVPMLGDYEVRVEMHDPVHAEAQETVTIGVIEPDNDQ